MVGSARAATPLSRGEKAAQRARGPPGRVLTQRLATERASNSDGRISAWRRKRDLGIALLCTSRPLIEFVLRHRAEATANIVLRPHNGLLSAPAWAAQFLFGLLLDRSGRSNYPVCPGSNRSPSSGEFRCEPDFRGPIPSIRPHCLDLAAAGFRHSRSGGNLRHRLAINHQCSLPVACIRPTRLGKLTVPIGSLCPYRSAASHWRSAAGNAHWRRGGASMMTVAVMPELASTPSGTSSMWMRTEIRWASCTHSKVGLALTSSSGPSGLSRLVMPRAMLSI